MDYYGKPKTRTVFRDPKLQATWEGFASFAIVILLVFPGAYILGTWKLLEFIHARAGMMGIAIFFMAITAIVLVIVQKWRDPDFRRRYLREIPCD